MSQYEVTFFLSNSTKNKETTSQERLLRVAERYLIQEVSMLCFIYCMFYIVCEVIFLGKREITYKASYSFCIYIKDQKLEQNMYIIALKFVHIYKVRL